MSAAALAALLRHYARATPDSDLLLAYAASRDGAAFRRLVERHGPMVMRLCRRLLGDEHAAEDAFQATFLTLARRAGSVRRPEALAAWLFGVARRVCGNARTARDRNREVEVRACPKSSTDPADELSARELLDALDTELDRLSERFRLPLLLVYWQGLTHAEAARRLGLTLGALHGRLVRGRAKLANRLRRRGFAPSTLLAAPLATAAVPSDLLAATAGLAVEPWSKALPAAVLALAATLTSSKLVPAVGLCVALAAAGFLGLATACGWGARTLTADPPAAPPPKAPESQVVRAARAEPMTRIVGVVVDEAGRPVAGARVNATWFRKAPDDVTTAADGSFSLRIGGPTRSSEIVGASADGGARQGLARFEESFSPTPVPVRIVLKPARALTVRVTDAKGTPVEGAAVEIPAAYGPLAQAVTDARGLARSRTGS